MRKVLLIILIMAFSGLFFLGWEALHFLNTKPGLDTETMVFEVPSGQSFIEVTNRLNQLSLIQKPLYLRIYARLTGHDQRLKKGEYALHRGMTPGQILAVLSSGKSILRGVTFPEGSNIFDMAAIVERKGFFSAKEFISYVRSPANAEKLLGFRAETLEGYLFPETYELTKYTELKELVAAMVQRFQVVYQELATKYSPKQSRHEIVTLASVVEKETGAGEERARIASVFYNRLNKKMRLQSDPTILYGILDSTGVMPENISKKDILAPTRYNTYTVAALPYGPIASPGRAALEAVMNPETTNYLYFVSRNDGTHVFSETFAQHNQAVKQFQLDRKAREGKSWRMLGTNQKKK